MVTTGPLPILLGFKLERAPQAIPTNLARLYYLKMSWFQTRTGSTGHSERCLSSIAWEASLRKHFRESLYSRALFASQTGVIVSSFRMKSLLECPESLCSEMPSLRLSESSSVAISSIQRNSNLL